MMIPNEVEQWIEKEGYGGIESMRPVGGGCINNGMVIRATTDQSFFLKTNSKAPKDMFAREVEGLEALRVTGGPSVPKPYLHGEDYLLMEDLSPAPQRRGYWEDFGVQMACLHNCTNERFGFENDNYIGSTTQRNTWEPDGYDFFAHHRLIFQAELAAKRGLFSKQEVEMVVRLAAQLPELVPAQPASIIHGDLWGGNAMTDKNGAPAVIDPAAHYGWAEADLAMTALFGGFDERFYAAYNEARRLEDGWRERFEIYNLYHLLNHLNLFGRGYYGGVMRRLKRFVQ